MSELSYRERLERLRGAMTRMGLDGFIVPHTDENLSEYLPADAERLAWLTGFTGSAGNAVALKDKAVVMTHGIYTLQIRKQVDQSVFEIGDMPQTSVGQWLSENAAAGSVIGYDPKLHTRSQIEAVEAAVKTMNVTLKAVDKNPLDDSWTDRPDKIFGAVELFPDKIAGLSSLEKRKAIAVSLQAEKIAAAVITMTDSVCWLLNVRGSDIPYNPLVLSNIILYADGSVDWFVDAVKVDAQVRQALGADVRIKSPQEFETSLAALTGTVMVDPQRSPMQAEILLKKAGCETVDGKDPCVRPKSIKTLTEQRAIKLAHVRDGVALCRFLYWLDCQDFARDPKTEIDLSDKLEEFRKASDAYRGPSFATISGWASNGAIIHYKATPESNQAITGNNLYLLDSGGQYEYGTTDVTRTIVIGEIPHQTKDHFTRVLKGHIALAQAVFDDTVDGAALDALTRAPLKDVGMDYAHGTGHGVGCFLAVHEEAPSISPRGAGATYQAGMLLSNEPGYYRENHYGIRHENLILCQEQDDGKLYWETITLAPFDLRGVLWDDLDESEIAWLKDYHRKIHATLAPYLASEELDWLHDACFSYFPGYIPPETDDGLDFN